MSAWRSTISAILPQFRKRTWINSYGEDWALYAGTLGTEMGLYQDPVAYASELRMEIARAVQLVVDTGLHAQGGTRERAVAYWIDNVGASRPQAENQIDRYMAWPAQALGVLATQWLIASVFGHADCH